MLTNRKCIVYYPRPPAGDLAIVERWRQLVDAYVGTEKKIIREFTAGDDDSMLELAIEQALAKKAAIVIPSLEATDESAQELMKLKESGIDYYFIEMPAPRVLFDWVTHVMFDHQRARRSERTKKAMKAAKDRGSKFGTPSNLTPEVQRKGLEARKANAANDEHNRQAAWYCAIYIGEGKTLDWIAERLNEMKLTTRRGSAWTKSNLHRVWKTYRDSTVIPPKELLEETRNHTKPTAGISPTVAGKKTKPRKK